ncbi:maltokinase N-terminal cap-like domain-containing protein [Streptomyces sp. NBC_00670]|uniref:maltokinase N-terminal cap-like domain-containing protein n=1 Tax=Streptomyces sp. NBC_00670 TaxID=2975804 RepID=UPI002E356824|nr:1,4-alpha-glucan branching protein [Streptomyces sp. NBC_00670]
MSVIHRTTLTPTKLELLISWLPTRPWYQRGTSEPELAKAGGFRLDDPEGEVGIEFMVVTDTDTDTDTDSAHQVTYLVPLTYRGAPLDGAEHALLGTTEHGVLGRRWVYDGCHDPVLVRQLTALLEGRAQPQMQSVSDTADPDVLVSHTADRPLPADFTVTDEPERTVLTAPRGTTLHLHRVLRPTPAESPSAFPEAAGHVTAGWQPPNGDPVRGVFAVLYDRP